MPPTTVFNKYATYDSPFLSNEVVAIASVVEPNLTTTWDLFQEMEPGRSTVVEWFDYESNPLTGAVGAGGWTDGVDTTALPIDAQLASIVNIGGVLEVGDTSVKEQVIVSAVDRGGLTIDVYSRGHSTSIGVAHLADVAISIIGSATVEGNVDIEAVLIDNLKRENFYQITQELIDVTKTATNQIYDDLGGEDVFDQKLMEGRQKKMVVTLKKLNFTALFGLPLKGTKTTPRTAGGIRHFLSQPEVVNVDAGASFGEQVLKDTLIKVGDRGGSPNIILCSTTTKSIINGFNAQASAGVQTRVPLSENVAGTRVNFYDGEGVGLVAVIADPLMRNDELYVLNNSKMLKKWFFNDMLQFVDEPSKSTSRKHVENLQGQFTLAFKDTTSDFARIFNL